MTIQFNQYFLDLDLLINKLNYQTFDCIIALKRSGFILGAVLSNHLDIPLFVPSEIESIPKQFQRCLVVDDKICTGKSIKKITNRLLKLNKSVTTAVLYVEGSIKSDIWIVETGQSCTMWYEKQKRKYKNYPIDNQLLT